MKTELYTTADIFEQLADEWDNLLDPTRSDNLFITNEWQRAWWEHLRWGDLSVVTVRDDDGVLRGIGSWFITDDPDGSRVVRIVGCTDVTDYMDILAQPGYEDEVFRALLRFMCSPEAPHWDRFSLCNIPGTSPTVERLPEIAREMGMNAEVRVQEVCPVVDLPDDYEAYLAMLDKKQRHELRRKRRRAEGHGVDWYIVGPEHDLDTEIDAFLEMMANSTPEKAAFLEKPGHKEFFRAIGHIFFEKGMLELIFLTIEDQRAAAMWQFAYHDRMLLYNSGLDPEAFAALSPGIVLLTYSVEDAIQKNMEKYDFLRGDETYKYRMGAEDTNVYNISIAR